MIRPWINFSAATGLPDIIIVFTVSVVNGLSPECSEKGPVPCTSKKYEAGLNLADTPFDEKAH